MLSWYKDWPRDPRQLDALSIETLALVVAERQAWLQRSLHRRAAAEHLGRRLSDFDRVVTERGIAAGRFGHAHQPAPATEAGLPLGSGLVFHP